MLRISVRQGAASGRSIPRFCVLPALGTGEQSCRHLPAPSAPAGAAPNPANPAVEKLPGKVIFSLCPLLHHHHPAAGFLVKVKCSRFVLAKKDASNREADGSAPSPVANPRKGLKQPAFNSADTALRVTHPSFQLGDMPEIRRGI